MIIVGAKGFAKEILEVLHQRGETQPIYFYDDITSDMPTMLLSNFPVLRNEAQAKEKLAEDNRFILGIGGPTVRKRLYEKFTSLGGAPHSVISPFAHIGHFGVQIKNGVCIMTGTVITADIKIDTGALINLNCTIGHDSSIGRFTELSQGVHVSGNCQIGNYCNLGTNCTILPRVTLGNHVVVGAGAVVTKDVADNQVVVGIPAKPLTK